MPDTIPGGAYLSADGKTWHDADGKPLSEKQVTTAEKLRDQRAARVAEQERVALEVQARNDPIARSLAAALRPQPGELLAIEQSQQEAPVPPEQRRVLVDVVGHEYADKLAEAGYGGIDDVARASDEELLAVEGIGPATLKKLRAARG